MNDEPVYPVESPSTFTFLHFCTQRCIESAFTLQHPCCCLLPCFAVYLCFRRKLGAEYASGVSRSCYSCNISYMQWIYSMCSVFSYPWIWLYTCVGMHMPNLLTSVPNVAQKMCDTQDILSCCHFYKVLKYKSFEGHSLGDVRGWYDWPIRSRTVFYDGQSFLLDYNVSNRSFFTYWTDTTPPRGITQQFTMNRVMI